jgi:large subunit ribosomal protein L21
MYAVVKTGGKQLKVAENDLLRIEKIDAEVGTIITLNDVLLVANDNNVTVGSPLVDGACVAIEILAQRRARKIIIFKKRRRKSSRTKNGHRQHFTLIRISEILTGGEKPTKQPQGMPEKFSSSVVQASEFIEEVAEEKTKKSRIKKATINKSDTNIDNVQQENNVVDVQISETEEKVSKKKTVAKTKIKSEENKASDSSEA